MKFSGVTGGLDLPEWTAGIKATSMFNANEDQEQQAPGGNPAGKKEHRQQQQQHHMEGARRVLAGAQANSTHHHPQAVLQHPGDGAMRADGLHGLPNVTDSQYWLRKAAKQEADGHPEEAERLLMEALQRDVRPATAIAHAIHSLHQRWDGSVTFAGVLDNYPSLPPPHCAANARCV